MKLVWHTFGSGTGAPRGKPYSWQAVTGALNGREMYMIDPIPWPSGRFKTYSLQYFGGGGYQQLGSSTRVNDLRREAQAHHDQHGVKTNPARGPRSPTKALGGSTAAQRAATARMLAANKLRRKHVRSPKQKAARKRKNTVAGYYPNPRPKKTVHSSHKYKVQLRSTRHDNKIVFATVASFADKAHAVEYGQALARKHRRAVKVIW